MPETRLELSGKRGRILAALALCLAGTTPSQGTGMTFEDPDHDFAFLEFEPYPEFKGASPTHGSSSPFWRVAGQATFPAGTVADRILFGAVKTTIFNRDIVYANRQLNEGALQRYWLSGGIGLVRAERQSGTFIAALGLNRDASGGKAQGLNSEWIYLHSFTTASGMQWGGGLDVMHFFGIVHFYPLVFLDWRLAESLKLKIDGDVAEVRQFLGRKFSLTLGTRFNQEFYTLRADANYQYQTVGVETGFQIAVGMNCYLRLKYKELVWGREYFTLAGEDRAEPINSGRSLRLNFAFGW